MFVLTTISILKMFILVTCNDDTTKISHEILSVPIQKDLAVHIRTLINLMDDKIIELRAAIHQKAAQNTDGILPRGFDNDALVFLTSPMPKRRMSHLSESLVTAIEILFTSTHPWSPYNDTVLTNVSCLKLEFEFKARRMHEMQLKRINPQQQQHVGYCDAAIAGIIHTVIVREHDHLKILKDGFQRILERIINNGLLKKFDGLLSSRIKLFYIWMLLTSVKTLRDKAHNIQVALIDKEKLNADVVKIFTQYDTLFTSDERKNLMATVTKLYDANNNSTVTDQNSIEALIESIINSLIAPINHVRDATTLTSLINTINEAYQRRYPDLPSSDIDALMNSITKYKRNQISSNATLLESTSKPKQDELTNLIEHLIKKQRTILDRFIAQFNSSNLDYHIQSKQHSRLYHRTRNYRYIDNQKQRRQQGKTSEKRNTIINRHGQQLRANQRTQRNGQLY